MIMKNVVAKECMIDLITINYVKYFQLSFSKSKMPVQPVCTALIDMYSYRYIHTSDGIIMKQPLN